MYKGNCVITFVLQLHGIQFSQLVGNSAIFMKGWHVMDISTRFNHYNLGHRAQLSSGHITGATPWRAQHESSDPSDGGLTVKRVNSIFATMKLLIDAPPRLDTTLSRRG
jgi:hypothetical protein